MLTLNGDRVGKLTNGEKKQFLEQLKLFIKLLFSQELMMEVAEEMKAEYDADCSRRDAANEQTGRNHNGEPQFNEC